MNCISNSCSCEGNTLYAQHAFEQQFSTDDDSSWMCSSSRPHKSKTKRKTNKLVSYDVYLAAVYVSAVFDVHDSAMCLGEKVSTNFCNFQLRSCNGKELYSMSHVSVHISFILSFEFVQM